MLYLKSQGVAHQDIRRIGRICDTTLTTYLRQYQEGGLARLKEQHYQGQANALQGTRQLWKRTSPPTHRRPVPRPAKS